MSCLGQHWHFYKGKLVPLRPGSICFYHSADSWVQLLGIRLQLFDASPNNWLELRRRAVLFSEHLQTNNCGYTGKAKHVYSLGFQEAPPNLEAFLIWVVCVCKNKLESLWKRGGFLQYIQYSSFHSVCKIPREEHFQSSESVCAMAWERSSGGCNLGTLNCFLFSFSCLLSFPLPLPSWEMRTVLSGPSLWQNQTCSQFQILQKPFEFRDLIPVRTS